jgi:hypothetical protein
MMKIMRKMFNLWQVCLTVPLCLLCLSGTAFAIPTLVGWRMATDDKQDGGLVSINTKTGQQTLLFSSTAPVMGVAYDFTSGVLYGAEATGMLVTIDVETGTLTEIGLVKGCTIQDISFDSNANRLFALSGKGDLIEIDPSTAGPTAITHFLVPMQRSLAVNPLTGEIFHAALNDPTLLYNFNLLTSEDSDVGYLGWYDYAMAFDPVSGDLFEYSLTFPGLDASDIYLVVHHATGEEEWFPSPYRTESLTFAEVPEPSTMFLLVCGLVGLAVFRGKSERKFTAVCHS